MLLIALFYKSILRDFLFLSLEIKLQGCEFGHVVEPLLKIIPLKEI